MGFEPEIFGSQSDALITCTQITFKVEKKSLLVFQVVCGMPRLRVALKLLGW